MESGRRPDPACLQGKTAPAAVTCRLSLKVEPVSASLALAAEAHLLGKLRAGGSIVGRNHRIARIQVPLFTILVWRQIIVGHQVTLERLELVAVLEADDIVAMDRAFGIYRRLLLVGRRLLAGPAHTAQGGVDIGNKVRQF